MTKRPYPTPEYSQSSVIDLTKDLDDSFWNAVPTPAVSPIKPKNLQVLTTPKKLPLNHRSNEQPSQIPSPSKVFSAGEIDLCSLLEGSEDWDWSHEPLTPEKPSLRSRAKALSDILPGTSGQYVPETCTRCSVQSVIQPPNGPFSKTLIVIAQPSKEYHQVVLWDDWAVIDIRVGDTVNVIGAFLPLASSSSTNSPTHSISITSKENALILHPDLLLTATVLSNTAQCRRKPILSTLVRSATDSSPSMLWGNMLHEVTQACLREGRWEQNWIEDKIDESIRQNLVDLVKNSVTIEQAKREVTLRAKGLRGFSERYLAQTPKPTAVLDDSRSTSNTPPLLAITNLLDVEEDIWSPKYGLKGKVDATVHGIISDPLPVTPFTRCNPQSKLTSGPLPLELKTGLASRGMEHRAQTMLYTLLLSERYGVDVPSGLLFYTQKEEVVRVPRGRNEIRGLLNARNEMASYIMRRTRNIDSGNGAVADIEEPFLPPTIDDERVCQRCYVLQTCMLYRRAVDRVVDTSSPIADIYSHHTSHLSDHQSAFFKQWERLIMLEEQDLVRFKKELWTMNAVEREAKGRCFSDMILDSGYSSVSQTEKGDLMGKDGKIHRYTYRFIRTAPKRGAETLLNGHMSVGDAITISVEPYLLALARGYIVDLSPSAVVLGVDHELSEQGIKSQLALRGNVPTQIIFRIDRDELFGGMGRIRDNLAQLFYVDGDTRRLELIVDLVPPQFTEPNDNIRHLSDPDVSRHLSGLNPNQKLAIRKVLSSHDYSMILGMPGTGKTTVIAAIIKILVDLGKTVLLTSYTHSAVDTILSKLHDAEFGILRLGNIDKVHPDVHKYTLPFRKTATTTEQLEQQLMGPPVVATTCLSVDHALFSRRRFDFCIVDEASQITLPTCLGPLRYADTFVLVGDHFQLPPLVRNPAARKGGLEASLFRRLSDAHPEAVVDLVYQYRMNEDIMLLSNKLIYGNRLRCGSDLVAKRSLVLPKRSFLAGLHSDKLTCHASGCWIDKLLAETCRAVFVDTDGLPAYDSRVGDLVQNEVEGDLVRQVAEALLRSGVKEDQIGILSLYRQQVKLLSHLLQSYKGIEILTADRSQGRDKDCIIISMVRSNDTGQIGDLLKDWRRVNVSFTRARSKLIIFGSRRTLQSTPLLEQFFDLMDSHGWILPLHPGANVVHPRLSATPSPLKRPAEDIIEVPPLGKKNKVIEKRSKQVKTKKRVAEVGLFKDRPILIDLVNEEA